IRTGLVASTVTPGRTAPDVSLTDPAMTAWASAVCGMTRALTTKSTPLTIPRIHSPRCARSLVTRRLVHGGILATLPQRSAGNQGLDRCRETRGSEFARQG